MTKLPFDQFEQAYEHLAQAIDIAGPNQESLFLAKLALALAHQLSGIDQFDAAIAMALQGLAPAEDRPDHLAEAGVP
ncbi:MAG: hypothetical protein ABL904_14640 [Hyphomicrobiaceae bacterium]